MTSDEALMLEFQGGSRAAFGELFARYHKPLYGFFRRRLNNPERAEDLAQETFLAVIRAASRYEPRALVRTYLCGIALKLLAAERRKVLTSSTLGQSAPEPKADGTPERVLWVRQAVEKLDAPERAGDVVAVQAEGNYVSLQRESDSYLLRESISTVAEKLKPYGFIRIHRSALVNTSFVVEIKPYPTGKYGLRVKGGKEYVVTSGYKKNLKPLTEFRIGSGAFLAE